MHTKNELCAKIRELYPDIGECGIDLEVDYHTPQRAWVVKLKKDGHELKTFLEPSDADACMLDSKCIGLGIEVAQLRGNVERLEE